MGTWRMGMDRNIMKNLQHYLAIQLKEIDEHKYYLSQRAGYDVGYEATIDDWIISGHAERFNQAYAVHEEVIEREIVVRGSVDVPNDLVHVLLGD
jgi:hypothetical protein